MVFILLSWCYILFTTINFGYAVVHHLKIKQTDIALTSLLGLFSVTIVASIFAVFSRINIEFHVLLLLLNILIFIRYKNPIFTIYRHFIAQIRISPKGLQFYLGIIFLLILAQCASLPYIIDNESYYIQTIKWLNEYGFVKGLANLHIFFGLTSGWHITQSAFSFSFLYDRFNDLSGYCLLLGNLFALERLSAYFRHHRKIDLVFGLIPVLNVFFFKFISAPSPDIPVYLIAFIVFYYFIEYYKTADSEIFSLLFLLAVFSVYIKTTSLVIILLPLFYLVKHYKILLTKVIPAGCVGLGVLLLFVIKNTIITGYQLYPLSSLHLINLDYTVPKEIMALVFDETKLNGYYITLEQFNSMTILEILQRWLFASSIDSLFNGMTLLMVLIGPIVIYKWFNKKTIWLIYFVALFHLILMFLSSPQYRYFIHFTLFFDLLLLSLFLTKKTTIHFVLYASLAAVVIVVLLPLNFTGLTANKLIAQNNYFSIGNCIIPQQNSKFTVDFETLQQGNLEYQPPVQQHFFWGTYDGRLPVVNKKQLEYFENYLHFIPQQRTQNIGDGFYSKKTTSHD